MPALYRRLGDGPSAPATGEKTRGARSLIDNRLYTPSAWHRMPRDYTARRAVKKNCEKEHPPELARIFSRNLRDWRRRRGDKLSTVADGLGLSVSIICEWEHCHRFPSAENLQKLADYMGLPAWELIRASGHDASSRMPRMTDVTRGASRSRRR
jgi:ribosome-binding protein aMBF1 (putative translation factor)